MTSHDISDRYKNRVKKIYQRPTMSTEGSSKEVHALHKSIKTCGGNRGEET